MFSLWRLVELDGRAAQVELWAHSACHAHTRLVYHLQLTNVYCPACCHPRPSVPPAAIIDQQSDPLAVAAAAAAEHGAQTPASSNNETQVGGQPTSPRVEAAPVVAGPCEVTQAAEGEAAAAEERLLQHSAFLADHLAKEKAAGTGRASKSPIVAPSKLVLLTAMLRGQEDAEVVAVAHPFWPLVSCTAGRREAMTELVDMLTCSVPSMSLPSATFLTVYCC